VNCTILPLAHLDTIDVSYIVRNLTKPDSDFQRTLLAGRRPGTIAIVRDQGEIVGWARTETWAEGDEDDAVWDTLEAFVATSHRMRGVAAFAAAGLAATSGCWSGMGVAVFHPHMLLVARRAGFRPTLFAKQVAVESRWHRV
jgi:hypothetical protein